MTSRQPRPDTLTQLQRCSSRLDHLISDVSCGATTHRRVEQLVAEAEAIADGIRAAVRGPGLR